MPQPPTPPFVAAALTYPRQLQRWLDVNYQGGPLTRTATYVTLPSFVQASNTWNGYSDIVVSFNFEGPNNFSLKPIPGAIVATVANFVLCVSWQSGGTVTRYMIWNAVGSNMNQEIPMYNGQLIKKNFRFEVWNTSQGIASLSSAINFYTSVLGNIDYRYATDSALVNSDAPCTNFKDNIQYAAPATNPGMMGSGATEPGGAEVNVLFIPTGTLNGKPSYQSQKQPLTTMYWDGSQWYVNVYYGPGHSGNYTNPDNTPTPDGAGQFTSGINVGSPPTFAAVNAFALPLIFPANSTSATD